MSQEKFMNSSIYLFLDLIVVAFSGWLYWLVISKLVSSPEVGQSTSVYSLVALTSTIIGLGLEYPLLKKSSSARSKILGSALIIELIMTLAAVSFIVYGLKDLHESLHMYTLISIVMLISISLGYVTRYALLGISASKTVLVIDTIGTAVKFATAYALVTWGFGTSGILLSFMLQALIVACIALPLVKKIFGFSTGGFNYIKDTLKDGIVNMPSIFSRTLIVTLSVVLLATFGIASSDIGIYYIALMISVVAGGLISSTAYMVIPASSITQTDLTAGSLRIGISMTAPIISLLLVSPGFLLSLIGAEYVSGQNLLLILAIGILPFAIVTNTISRFNYIAQSRRLLFVGALEIIGFIVSFIILVPQYGSIGAALSILISYSISCVPALIWSERILLRYIANTTIAVAASWGICNLLKLFIPHGIISEVTTLFLSVAITMVIILVLKNTSISEIRTLLKSAVANTP
jgi:O-antigen/teichoic acid export membrane protein